MCSTSCLVRLDLPKMPDRSTFLSVNFWRTMLTLSLGILIALSVWFRVMKLDNIPGVNGDEAWYGIQAQRMLAGEAFDWLTPSRVPLNPMHIGPLALALMIFEPEFWVLRIPSVLSGLILIPVAYFSLSNAFDRFTARCVTLLICIHPICISQSRFGWDASHTALASLMVIRYALTGMESKSAIWFGIAILVHPTNIFLLPLIILLLISAGDFRNRDSITYSISRKVLGSRPAMQLIAISVVILVVAAIYCTFRMIQSRHGFPIQSTKSLLHIINGVSTYNYIIGNSNDRIRPVFDIVSLASIAFTVAFGTIHFLRTRFWEPISLLIGMACAIGLILPISNFRALLNERYLFFILIPFFIYLALCLRAIVTVLEAKNIRNPDLIVMTTLAISCALSLKTFQVVYFGNLYSGIAGHRCFVTAPIEPKRQSWSAILEDSKLLRNIVLPNSKMQRKISVLTTDWWLQQPLQYLADVRNDVEITSLRLDGFPEREPNDAEHQSRRIIEFLREGGYVVCFRNDFIDRTITRMIPESQLTVFDVLDFRNEVLIRIFRLHRTDPSSLVR